jgi:hypothetical protein
MRPILAAACSAKLSANPSSFERRYKNFRSGTRRLHAFDLYFFHHHDRPSGRVAVRHSAGVRLVAIGTLDRTEEEQELSMQTAELVVLWSSLAIAFYAYVVYPLAIGIASRFARRAAPAPELDGTRMFSCPKVTLLLATRREESTIVDRLRNAAALNYPPDRLEILVGCDGDGDLTALLARSVEDPRVKVVQLPEQRGTATVLNECMAKASGEIVVFSDVSTTMRPDALRRLVRHFQRDDVGAVCGKLLRIDPMTGRNLTGLLSKFETLLTRCEARLGALSQVNGGIYAIRKCLYLPIRDDGTAGDLRDAQPRRKQRFRLVYDDTAIAVEETPPAMESQLRTRSKGGSRERLLRRQLASHLGGRSAVIFVLCRFHKGLRRYCAALLLAAFVSNACLSNDPLYLHLLLLHESLYLFALIALFFAAGVRGRRMARLPVRVLSRFAKAVPGKWDPSPRMSGAVAEPRPGRPAANQFLR